MKYINKKSGLYISKIIQFSYIMQSHLLNEESILIVSFLEATKNISYIIYPFQDYKTIREQVFEALAESTRPYLFIRKFDFWFWFIFIWMVIAIAAVQTQILYYLLNEKKLKFQKQAKPKNWIQQIQTNNCIMIAINIFLAITYFSGDKLLLNYLLDLSLYQCQQLDTLKFILACILILVSLLFLICKQKYFGQTYLMISNNNSIIIILICICQSIIFIFFEQLILLQLIITMISSIYWIKLSYSHIFYTQRTLHNIIVYSQSFTFLLGLIIVLEYEQVVQYEKSRIVLFFLYPLLVKVIMFFNRKQLYSRFYNFNQETIQEEDLKKLIQLVHAYGNHNFSDHFYQYILVYFHQQICTKNHKFNNECILQKLCQLLIRQTNSNHYVENQLLNCYVLIDCSNYIDSYIIVANMKNSYESQDFSNHKIYLNKSQQARCILIAEISKFQLKQKLFKYEQIEFEFLDDFYQAQLLRELITKYIFKSIGLKREFFKQFIEMRKRDLFSLCYNYSKKLNNNLRKLKNLNQLNRNIYLTNMITFFYAEILNDYIAAEDQHQIILDYQDNVYNMKNSLNFLARSSKIAYVITVIKDREFNMRILNKSNNFEQFFQTTTSDSIDQLIPDGIREYHSGYIRQLLVDGQSKRYRALSRVFANQKQYINLVDSYLDTYYTMDQLQFVNIFIEKEDVKGYILLNNRFQITGINRTFLQMMGYQQKKIQNFQSSQLLYGVNIDRIIPNFKNHIDSQMTQRSISTLKSLNVFTNQKYFDIYFYKSKLISILTSEDLEFKENLNVYEALIDVEVKHLGPTITYFVLSIDSIRKKSLTMSTFNQSLSPKGNDNDPFSDSDINNHYSEDVFLDFPLDFDEEYNNDNYKLETPVESTSPFFKKPSNLIIKSSRRSLQKRSQQKYYTRRYAQAHSNTSVEQGRGRFKRISRMNMNLDAEQSSILSGVYDLRKSKYYDKYTLINKVSKIKVQNKYTIGSAIYFILSCALGMLSLILQSSILNSDFDIYQKDIEYLEVRSKLILPFLDLQLLRYNFLGDRQKEGEQDLIIFELQEEIKHFQQNIEWLKSNPILIEYAEIDQEIYLIYQDLKEPQKVDFYTLLDQFQSQQLELISIYIRLEKPTQQTPSLHFLYKNHQQFIKSLNTIMNYQFKATLQRNASQFDRQISLITGFLTANLICLFCSFYYNRKQNILKSQFLCYFQYIDKNTFCEEIDILDKLKQIYSIEDIQFYQFCLVEKEKQILKMEQLKNRLKQDQNRFFNLQSNFSVCTFYNILMVWIFMFLFIINFANSMILQNFILLFKPSAILSTNITDTGVSIATIYAQREILFNANLINFLTDNEIQQIKNQVDASLSQIQRVQGTFSNLRKSEFLFTSNFMNLLDSIQFENICLSGLLHGGYSELNCYQLFDHSFEVGLQGVLSYVSTTISSQSNYQYNYSIEQNTIDTQTKKYDNLGALSFSQVIEYIINQCQQDVLNQTQKYNQTLSIILISSITFILILALIMIYIQVFKFNQHLKIAKKFIHLLPHQVLFLDHSFERRVTTTILKNKNI